MMNNKSILSFLPFTATNQQATALNTIESFLSDNNDFMIVRGAAGTGKTSIMKAVVDYLCSENQSFQLLAPMGRSAKTISHKTNYSAKTIHSHIYIPETDVEKAVTQLNRRINENSKKQVFIIDESSMLSNKLSTNGEFESKKPLLTDLIEYIKQGNPSNKIIFVGDDCQLPPVGYEVFEKSPALNVEFVQKVFSLKGIQTELTEVKRFDESSSIYQTAYQIRENIYGNKASLPRNIGNYYSKAEQATNLYLERF